jgi:hypothetical protein
MTGRTREIWLKTGHCSTCANKTYPGPNKHECISDPCDDERGFLKNDGTCNTCPDYTYPVKEAMECRNDTCDNLGTHPKQYKMLDGHCFTCGDDEYAYFNSSGSGCTQIPTIPPPECPPPILTPGALISFGLSPDADLDKLSWGLDIDDKC